ncbi:tRNA (5-methylaminomethyl-2-thiouridine)(34)-methyltransferase MnmD [Roseovarius salinarum]|uniref:tRNA (5-methylaminomethyl-2-thiouridine)(34)-methyltransferase MnmD n=1 Tax=Roseovarius salinarum TaxID=1981892 RepID=UPI000C33069D|nr:tRNA (5-methylaminomethyl-2-thiouridine)(34)-methyltransferase MnmD [Roseovarius salinarum]
MHDQQAAEIEWRAGGVPVSRRFDDPYYSLEDGLAEARHVFLSGNGLPGRFRAGFHIAELGFGTGLNMLAALDLWRRAGPGGTLHYTAFEMHPLGVDEMRRALAAFPDLADVAAELAPHCGMGACEIALDDVAFTLVEGDARATLPAWEGRADAWFLDGFAPARNPELWEPALLVQVARHTVPDGTAATYTAAGAVRRGLAEAGFAVTRAPGFGRKRHMTTARLERAA